MKAVILCAGKGSRLRPYTYIIPKPLLKIKGISILEHIFNSLYSKEGYPIFDTVYVVVDYMKEKIISYCAVSKKQHKFDIITLLQCNINGTSGGIYSVKDLMTEPFVVLNGDIIFDKEDIFGLATSKPENVVGSYIAEDAYNYGVLQIQNNIITGIEEKPQRGRFEDIMYVSAGMYKFSKSIFDYVPLTFIRGNEYIEADTINLSIQNGNIFTPYYLEHDPTHISTVDDYRRHR